MKNNINHQIKISRDPSSYRAIRIDIMRNGVVVRKNHSQLSNRPKRKRRINYEKKIMNDSFLFNV